MDSIIENMYRKRFGISKEDDIKNTKPSCCYCGTQFYHMACCIKGNISSGKVNILSFGENKYSPTTNLESVRSSIHAEQNAINQPRQDAGGEYRIHAQRDILGLLAAPDLDDLRNE